MKSLKDHSSSEESEQNQPTVNDNDMKSLLITQSNLTSGTNLVKNELNIDENRTSHLPYYYKDVDRNKSEWILRSVNRPGCFLIRHHEHNSPASLVRSPYVLSIVDPSLKIVHYLLYRINQCLFIKPFSDEFYTSVKDLIEAYRKDAGILPCTLVEYPVRCLPNNDAFCLSLNNILSSSLSIEPNRLIRQEIIGRGYFGIVYKG